MRVYLIRRGEQAQSSGVTGPAYRRDETAASRIDLLKGAAAPATKSAAISKSLPQAPPPAPTFFQPFERVELCVVEHVFKEQFVIRLW